MLIKRGYLFWVNRSPSKGSEQSGCRPALVIQNDTGNTLAPTTIIAPLTTQSFSKEHPTHVNLPKGVGNFKSGLKLIQLITFLILKIYFINTF